MRGENDPYGDHTRDGAHGAHLGVAEDDPERSGDEEEEDAVAEEERIRGGGRRHGLKLRRLAPICEQRKGGNEVQEVAHDESNEDEARRRGIARSSPAVEAEQGMLELLMAAAAREAGDGNGNLGFRGSSGRPYMGGAALAARGAPLPRRRLAVREKATLRWKEDEAETLAGGASGKKTAYRFARSGWAARGKERRVGPREKRDRAQHPEGFLHLKKQQPFWSFVEQLAKK